MTTTTIMITIKKYSNYPYKSDLKHHTFSVSSVGEADTFQLGAMLARDTQAGDIIFLEGYFLLFFLVLNTVVGVLELAKL
jgi:hypothetical protein